jgi:hypothetical protein
MNFRTRLAATIGAAALLASTALIASAAPVTQTQATVTIDGGARTVSIAGGAFGNIPYSFVAQDDVPATFTVLVSDATGSGTGWHVTITGDPFDGTTVGNTFAVTNLDLASPVKTITATGSDPVSSFTANAITMTGGIQTLITAAADGGEGSYQVDYSGLLDIPAQQRADTYTSVITVAIEQGP